jgi:hypothetical protein
MAVVNLVEAAKTAREQGDFQRAAFIEIFYDQSDLLRRMLFEDVVGAGQPYNVEGAMPGVGFRGLNEAYTPTIGVVNPQFEALKVAGGEIHIDTATAQMFPASRPRQEVAQAKAMAHKLSVTFINGDSGVDPREFDGLKTRLKDSNLLANSTAANGTGLSIAKLDEAMDLCENPNALLMTKKSRRRLTEYLRGSPSIQTSRDEFGRQVMSYNGVEILLADQYGDTANIGEAEDYAGGGTADGTSIYVLHIEPGYLAGIQNGIMQVDDLGKLESKPAWGTRVEWLVSMYVPHPRSAIRLHSIDPNVVAIA